MEDFIGILILIIYLIVAFSGKKKKAKNKRQKQREGFEKAFSSQAKPKGKQPLKQETPSKPLHEQAACVQQRMHVHEVTQQQMHLAGEGEDPCHSGSAPERQEETFDVHESQEGEELAKDVLRGVMMSEILMRPCDRMALKRNKWSAV